MKKLTKQEFEDGYISRSGITKEKYDKYQVTMRCNCEYEQCEGWAAVSNNQLAIEAHKRLYQN